MGSFGPTITKRAEGEHTASVIFLHGIGESGVKLSKILASFSVPNVKFVFPTAPVRRVTALGNATTAWFDVVAYDDVKRGKTDIEGIPQSVEWLESLVKAELAAGVPYRAICVGGFSNGGHIALQYYLSKSTEPVGGVFGFSTAISDVLCKGLTSQQKRTKLFLALGSEDPLKPEHFSDPAVKALKEEGVEEIEYKVYSGATHEITQDMREDFRAWLLNFVSKGTTA